MAPPTAPPTPPTQQQPQQQQQAQYAVAQGGQQQQRSAAYNPRAASANVRRPQQPQPQQFIYSQPLPPYNFVIPNHIRQAVPISAQPYPTQVFAQQLQPFAYYPPAQSYQQMTAPAANGQRQSTTASSGPPSMPTTNEYPSYVYDPSVMPVMPQPPAVQQQPQKTTKKTGSKALTIINPATGKSIFEDDSSAVNNEQEKVDHKEETEKENSDPSTPVVSAMSDGPSVDITPKHTVKNKKSKPPETIPQLADPPRRIETTIESVEVVSQDSENNNGTTTVEITTEPIIIPPPKSLTPPPVVEEPIVQAPVQQPQPTSVSVPSNDTNNNNYQKVTADENENEQEIPEQQV